MSAELAACHRIEPSRDQCRLALMEIRSRLLAYLDVTSKHSQERRYVMRAEAMVSSALVNMESDNGP